MPVSMSQEYLTNLLESRGWRITDLRGKTDWKKEQCGISMHAVSLTGYVLSIQAGIGLYSEPRQKADSYTEIEFAIWKDSGEGNKESPYITDKKIKETIDDVYGYESFEVLMRAVRVIEHWIPGDEPKPVSIHREIPPYRDLN